jgi:prophage DNA circulation protein
MAVKWLDDPEDHDYEAAADYLSLVSEAEAVTATVDALKSAQTSERKAKDVLRAARLDLLPATNPRVKTDLARIDAGKKLSPVLLVRGKVLDGVALQIADGYHRVCASYLNDENTPIPCRLVSWQTPG